VSGSGARRWLQLGGGVAAVMCGAGLLAACGGPAIASDPPACGGTAPRLTVQGAGIASGTPDLLTLTADVSVSDPTAQGALADDSTRTAAVMAALTRSGVATADLQTTGLTVQPNYVLRDNTTVLAGYSVDNTVVAKLRDFSSAGAAIDEVVAAAGDATRIDSLTFSIEDPRGLQDRARQDAVRQAVSHAAAMAAAAGERLGPVCSLSDDSATSVPSSYQRALGDNVAAPSVPLRAGTQQASAQVSIVYALASPRLR
jgi:uncharacterized protein